MTEATDSVADRRQRQQIRDAMSRLIAGTAVHSDGKLTIKGLAEEAQVKRWLLTHRHTDLQAEFRARIADTARSQPPVIRKLQDAHSEATETIQALRAEITDLKATLRQFERVVQVLALENDELRNQTVNPGNTALSVVPSTGPKRRRPTTAGMPRNPCS